MTTGFSTDAGWQPAALARMVAEHDTTLWRIVHHCVDRARAAADFSGVGRVGLDDKASRRGHHYVTLFVDLEDSRLLYSKGTREATTLDAVLHGADMANARRMMINRVCDSWGSNRERFEARVPERIARARGVRRKCPTAHHASRNVGAEGVRPREPAHRLPAFFGMHAPDSERQSMLRKFQARGQTVDTVR